ncbi:MAG: type IV pilin protein [Cycloclasticus sp.]
MIKKPSYGFTLIELMIVVVVISVLAALAYPAYQDYGARRADAKAALLDIQLNQEKWRANNSTYASTRASVWANGASSLDGYYTLAVSGGTATQYSAEATPTGIQVGDDCGIFAVDVNGEDKTTTSGYATVDCWNR